MTMPGFDAAQRVYDNMSPPEDGPTQCYECGGSGYAPETEDHEDELKCEACDGFGWVDAEGEPFDPNAAERARDEHADWLREERRSA